MKFWKNFLTQAFLISLVSLFLGQIFESIFPHLVSSILTVDKLLEIVIFTGVCWALVTWHITHFERKHN